MSSERKDNLQGSVPPPRNRNGIFWSAMIGFGLVYLLLIASMIAADFGYVTFDDLRETFNDENVRYSICLLYTSPSPRDLSTSRMPSSA